MADKHSARQNDNKNDTTAHADSWGITTLLRTCIRLLPANAPQFIYTKILRPWPLRQLANGILRKIIPESITIPEGVLYLNPTDPVVSGALLLGAYEAYFAEVFRGQLRDGMTVLDIGANLGYYTLIASKSAGHVVAFEPESENRALLYKTLAENKRPNVRVIDKGVSDTMGRGMLALDPDNKGKHSLLPASGSAQTEIQLSTVDAVLREEGMQHVDLIKMDIEGWEGHAFIGMHDTLHRDHPTIMFEFAPLRIKEAGKDPAGVLDSLCTLGYQLSLIDEGTHKLVPVTINTALVESLRGFDDYVNIIAVAGADSSTHS